MESRKDQLQQQIIEALRANDKDLNSLLRSQWAHRFGVESLEELKDLDLTLENQKPTKEDHQETDRTQDDFFQADKEISIKNDENKEKEIINDTNKVTMSVELENKESFEIKSNEIFDKGKNENNLVNQFGEYKNPPKVEALIPLPPKPKDSYLKKWLLRS